MPGRVSIYGLSVLKHMQITIVRLCRGERIFSVPSNHHNHFLSRDIDTSPWSSVNLR